MKQKKTWTSKLLAAVFVRAPTADVLPSLTCCASSLLQRYVYKKSDQAVLKKGKAFSE